MSVCSRTENGHVRYLCKYKDEDGRWRQRSFKSEAEARQFDAESKYDAEENKRMTLLDCVVAFIQGTPHCAKLRRQYEMLVLGGKVVSGPAELIADKYADELDRRDLENFRLACRQNGDSEATVCLQEGRIKAALNWCASEDLISGNPWARYRRPRHVVHQSRNSDPADFARIYAVLPPWMQWACRTCIALCLRPGDAELGALTWSSIDLDKGVATVWMPKVKRMKTVVTPEWWTAEARERRASANPDDYVCPNRRGARFRHSNMIKIWDRARVRVGVHMTMYAMRHLAASAMLEAGADPISVAAQLGHSNVATTAQFYAHARRRAQEKAARTIPSPEMVRIGAGLDEKDK